MNEVLEKIQKIGIVPVVVLDDAKDAEPLAKALCEGGLPCAEVSFRTEAAEESIHIISEKYPEMLVGAGTVLTTEQVDRAVAAGACNHGNPLLGHLAHIADHVQMLLVGHGGRLAGGAAGNDRVGSPCDLLLQQCLKFLIIYLSRFCKRGYQCNACALKNSHDFFLLMCL